MCALGFLDGFTKVDADWNIHVLSSSSAMEYHSLARRYPRFRHLAGAPHGTFAAAVMLSQPREIGHVVELHRHALVTAFLMLDAIAWDIYPGRTGVEATWRFVARHADGLLYISHFTRERFNKRFPVAPNVAEAVTHLSMAQDDHADLSGAADPVSTQILIFGNGFDHKHVHPTAQLLADAFPFHRIMAIGIEDAPRPNVTAVASGQTPRGTLLRLIAGAGVIVFPSLYEGFGLPVVEGLAHGRTVLVRRSALWTEIAAFSRLPGRLCEFDDPASLVDGVGRALAGLPFTELPRGIALADGAAPANWKDCAQRIVDLLAGRLANLRLDHWWAREDALRIMPQ
jgi:glycosyltransferase involved in cell wall biosynthesis